MHVWKRKLSLNFGCYPDLDQHLRISEGIFTTLPIFARNRKNSAYTLLITRRQILMTFFQGVMSHQQQTNFGADLERDPYTGIFNGISLSRDRSNCKIFASNSINNDYNFGR